MCLCDTPGCHLRQPTTYKLAKVLVKIKWVSLVNLVGYKEVVKEFIQHIDEIEVAEYLRALCSGEKRYEVIENINELKSKLKASPSENAAIRVLEKIRG